MDNDFFIRQIKTNILSNKYGKFDFVEKVVDGGILMSAKPRVILQILSSVLDLSIDKINYQTFNSWLRCYRKRESRQLQTTHLREVTKNNGNDWKNFIPSEPQKISDKEPIIKIVK